MTGKLLALSLSVGALASLAVAAATPAFAIQQRVPHCSCYQTVERRADSKDYVCVSQASRNLIVQENGKAAQNRVSASNITCKSGFVWRDAFDGDAVCVTPQARDRVHGETANWKNNVDPYAPGPCNTLK